VTVRVVIVVAFVIVTVTDWLMLGVKKPYYVRDYLSPKHIKEHGLAEILEAMEFSDRNNDNCKKQLLSYLWPHTSQKFSTIFQPFKREKPGVQNDDDNQGDSSVSLSTDFCGVSSALRLLLAASHSESGCVDNL